MTGAVVCGSGMLWAGLVDGHRAAFLVWPWGVGVCPCVGVVLGAGRRGSVARGVAQCAQLGAFRFVFTLLYFSCKPI